MSRQPKFGIEIATLLLIEAPDVANGAGIRSALDSKLSSTYGISFDELQKRFTVVTDGAAVIARMAGSSVSANICPPDERWMRCHVHVLNNCMKAAMEQCTDSPLLLRIAEDFKAVKKIVEDGKRPGWSTKLQSGHHLVQDVETRFSTNLLVADRFLKSAEQAYSLMVSFRREGALQAFHSLFHQLGSGFPAIEAISDTFKVVYEAIILFQKAKGPTITYVLPSMLDCCIELRRMENGGMIQRSESTQVSPTQYTRSFCAVLRTCLEKVEVHDLWLVGCFLNPCTRDLRFWPNEQQRASFLMRAENLTRNLCALYQDNDSTQVVPSSQEEGPGRVTIAQLSTSRKRKFSMADYLDIGVGSIQEHDEVQRYKSMDLSSIGLDPARFLEDEFAVAHFWYEIKLQYPNLFKTAKRVLATPVSSCSSERVFRVLKKLVTADRARLDANIVEDLIVSRSLIM